jgi:hypothetical protein
MQKDEQEGMTRGRFDMGIFAILNADHAKMLTTCDIAQVYTPTLLQKLM